jgi:hypothetical protein
MDVRPVLVREHASGILYARGVDIAGLATLAGTSPVDLLAFVRTVTKIALPRCLIDAPNSVTELKHRSEEIDDLGAHQGLSVALPSFENAARGLDGVGPQ